MRFVYASGTRPLEGYTIKRGIGVGGFGEVYFALSDAGKEVALKRIQRNLDIEIRGVKQCLNLKHHNLLSLYDIKYDDQGEAWVVMEYIKGESLRDVLERNPHGLPLDQVRTWFKGICDGVEYLHDHGIVHRDLKPGNIFCDEGVVKIGDYGLSKFISCSRRSGQTESVGTFHYMAPEIGRGSYGKEIDVYALGIILYEMLTGRVPFEGESSQEIIMKHLTAEPDLSILPAAYREAVRKSLLKDPERRFHNVAEMLHEVKMIGEGDVRFVSGAKQAPENDVYYIGESAPEMVFGPVRAVAQGSPDAGPRMTRPPGPSEPIARAVWQSGKDLRNWWANTGLSSPVKTILLVVLVILAVLNLGWIMPAAIGLGAIYLVYFGIRALVLAVAAPTTSPAPATPAARAPLPRSPAPAASPPPPAAPVTPAATAAKRRLWQEAARKSLASRTGPERVSEFISSLLVAAIACGVLSLVAMLVADKPLDTSVFTWTFYAWLTTTSVAGSWILLTLGKFWETSQGDAMRRRFAMLIAGLCLGAVAFGTNRYLASDVSGRIASTVQHVSWARPVEQAFLPAFLLYFGAQFLLLRWWRLADPLRSSRFSIWDSGVCLFWAWMFTAIWPFLIPWGPLTAGVIAIAVQISAPWINAKERQRIRQQIA